MKKIKIAPISYEHKRGQKTQIPINILVDILITLGYKKNNNEQIIYEKLTDEEISDIEEICIEELGDNQLDWSYTIQTKYKNEILGRKIFDSFLPILPKFMENNELNGDIIMDAARVYEKNEMYQFTIFGAFQAGDNFTEEQFNKKNRKTKYYGFLLNTTRNPGIHWVFLLVNIYENSIEYFDSLGNNPKQLVIVTIQSIINVLKNKIYNNLTCDIYYSNKRLQYESTECGVYCLWFLDKRLNGIEFKKFCNDDFNDKQCQTLRNKFWNKE